MVSATVFVLSIVATAIITFFVTMSLTPLKNWINSEHKEQCAYDIKQNPHPLIHDIIITKKLNKTSHINCYWFNRRETKTIDDITYKECFYGEKFLTPTNKRSAVQCPFDKQYF